MLPGAQGISFEMVLPCVSPWPNKVADVASAPESRVRRLSFGMATPDYF
jgi:hypothetical protein